jgi:4-hydroxy-4-methyl-2-oxoglutarate aldolase
LLATSLMTRGVRGLIMGAGVRDIADLNELGFPVWTRHISCQGPVKDTPGSVNVPIAINGQVINPGDVIAADDDGVVVVARAEADWALEQSEARVTREEGTRAKLAAGELGLDFYGHRKRLEDYGVQYLDSATDL